jgi:cell division protein FtsB
MQVLPLEYVCSLVIVLFCAAAGTADQGTDEELRALRRQIAALERQVQEANETYAAEIRVLQEKIAALHGEPSPVAAANRGQEKPSEPDEDAAAPTGGASPAGPAGRTAPSFNPDISAIGDVLFHAGRSEPHADDSPIRLRELELAFGAAVDPYGRADFFVAIEEEDGEFRADVEEGYFTFDTLPYDLKARVGKFYSAFGKANQYHLHAMPWVDRPLVIRRFFGEEGMSEPGAELSWLVPNPWNDYMELIIQLQSNENPVSFAGDRGNDLLYVMHLKNFFDLDRQSTLEVGGSFAAGPHTDHGSNRRTYLEGVDLTYKWRPAQQGLYQSLTWMNEVLLSQRQQGQGETVDSAGLYSALEYQFDRRWSVFGRYDYSQFPDDDDSHEHAFSPGLTFRQSEYAFWRLQYTHTEGAGSSSSGRRDELFLQLDFGIGPHRAHAY